MKANAKLDGKPCAWCRSELQLGDDSAICSICDQPYHATCWDSHAGCATASCANAPLRQLAEPVAPARPHTPGLMYCPSCRQAIPEGTLICGMCRAITSPDGIYHGPKTNAPGAVSSLVWGIIGLFLCGMILGIVAISKSNEARRAIASDPTLTGGGLAAAGMVLGILDLIGWGIIMMLRMGGSL